MNNMNNNMNNMNNNMYNNMNNNMINNMYNTMNNNMINNMYNTMNMNQNNNSLIDTNNFMNNNFNNVNNYNFQFNNNFNTMNNNFPNFQNNPYFNNPYNNCNNCYNFNNAFFMMNFQNNLLFQNRLYQMMLQQTMFNYILMLMRFKNMNNYFNQKNNNDINNINNEDNIIQDYLKSQDYKLGQQLQDVMQEANIPLDLYNNNNDLTTSLSFDINTEILTAFMNINPNLLSGFGNNLKGKWPKNEYRGGKKYQPPTGWIGFGLNVLNKYDSGNNDWLACNGRSGEWCVAYHGACRRKNSDEVIKIIKVILESNLKPGIGQQYKDSMDINHPGKKVGVGVYCSPDINVIESYSGIMIILGNRYKVAFMLRVKQDKIKIIPSIKRDYWVLEGDFSELRPYRLLIKKV